MTVTTEINSLNRLSTNISDCYTRSIGQKKTVSGHLCHRRIRKRHQHPFRTVNAEIKYRIKYLNGFMIFSVEGEKKRVPMTL